jgi:hypothetical protein
MIGFACWPLSDFLKDHFAVFSFSRFYDFKPSYWFHRHTHSTHFAYGVSFPDQQPTKSNVGIKGAEHLKNDYWLKSASLTRWTTKLKIATLKSAMSNLLTKNIMFRLAALVASCEKLKSYYCGLRWQIRSSKPVLSSHRYERLWLWDQMVNVTLYLNTVEA